MFTTTLPPRALYKVMFLNTAIPEGVVRRICWESTVSAKHTAFLCSIFVFRLFGHRRDFVATHLTVLAITVLIFDSINEHMSVLWENVIGVFTLFAAMPTSPRAV